MEYLKRVLGIEVLYENKALEHLPNFISTRYDSQKVSLSGQKAVFLYPKTELEQVETLKKHLERVKKVADCPVILVLDQITARQKEYLLREKIAFIVDGKQIYLPFMAAYLQERCDAEKSDREEILPSAQMLLLYYIYEGAKELSTSQAAKDLDLTPTSISRASKQLEGMGFLRSRKNGVQKILLSENSAKEVSESLHQQMDRKKRPGWIRGDAFDIEASHAEILSLNKKIRELEQENAELKSQIVKRVPELMAAVVLDQQDDKEVDGKGLKTHGKLLIDSSDNAIKIQLYHNDGEC